MILKLAQMNTGGERAAEPKYLYVNAAHIMAFSPHQDGCQIDMETITITVKRERPS